jgi:endonuclease-3
MAQASKTQRIHQLQQSIHRHYKTGSSRPKLSVFESVVYALCLEDSTREGAMQALARFKDHFSDWNEVRVSSLKEIQEVLAGLSDPEGRSDRIRRFLRQLFSRTYGFSLENLAKKPLKEAIKSLKEFDAFASDFVLSSVIQIGLAGHAIPIDKSSYLVLHRLGVVDDGTDPAAVRGLLERAIPKNRGMEFVEELHELAHDVCHIENPDCPRCELRKLCPYGQERLARERSSARAAAKAESAAARSAAKPTAKSAPKSSAKTAAPAAARKPEAKGPATPPARAAGSAKSKTTSPKSAKVTKPAGRGKANRG